MAVIRYSILSLRFNQHQGTGNRCNCQFEGEQRRAVLGVAGRAKASRQSLLAFAVSGVSGQAMRMGCAHVANTLVFG